MNETDLKCKTGEAGFTPLEMIAAVCLIALAFTLVMPRLGATRQAMKLRATAVELSSNLKITRAAALRSNSDAVLVIDTNNRKYATAGVVKPQQIPRDMALTFEAKAGEATGAAQGGFRFRPDGTASGGHIRLKSGTNAAVITIDWLTGAVTLAMR
jgi:general secretion pathway protein H